MKITIGMPSHNNFQQVYFTVQALRMYQNLEHCEILIIDNYGCKELKNWVNNCGGSQVRYLKFAQAQGTAWAKNKVFEHAAGDFVVCIDSHVLLWADAIVKLKAWIVKNPESKDLIQGPLVYDQLDIFSDHLKDEWRTSFWGVWSDAVRELPSEPYEIFMQGMGLFGCFKSAWQGFNPKFSGFGGEEGYIHEKFRKAGHKVICLPFLKWVHKFHDQSTKTTYRNVLEDRIKNYVLGYKELGLDMNRVIDHFSGFSIQMENGIRIRRGK